MDQTEFNRKFVDIKPINKGGTGTIYKAYHRSLGKYVVLKKVTSSANLKLIRREVDILKNLKHSYLPAVHDLIELDGAVFIVEDFIGGTDLSQYIKSRRFVPEEYIIKWLLQMCDVLEYLHSRKPAVIHSDIKPGNIMIDEHYDICLIDFNISVLHELDRNPVGFSQYYCSPEQQAQARTFALGGRSDSVRVDETTDIYSTCATFYTLMSGLLPSSEKPNFPLKKLKNLPYSDGLASFIDKGMSYLPQDRFQSAKQMRHALTHLNTLTEKYKSYKRARWLVSVIGAALMAVGIVISISGAYNNNIESVQTKAGEFISEYYQNGAETLTIPGELTDRSNEKYIKKCDNGVEFYMTAADTYKMSDNAEKCVEYYKKAFDLLVERYEKEKLSREEFIEKNLDLLIPMIRAFGENRVDMQHILKPLNEEKLGREDERGMLATVSAIYVDYFSDSVSSIDSMAEQLIASSGGANKTLLAEVCHIASEACFRDVKIDRAVFWSKKATEYVQNMEYYAYLMGAYIKSELFEDAERLYVEKSAVFERDDIDYSSEPNAIDFRLDFKVNYVIASLKLNHLSGKREILDSVISSCGSTRNRIKLKAQYNMVFLLRAQNNGTEARKYAEEALKTYDLIGKDDESILSREKLDSLISIRGGA